MESGLFEITDELCVFMCPTYRRFPDARRYGETDLYARDSESGMGSLPMFSSTKFTRRNLKRDENQPMNRGDTEGGVIGLRFRLLVRSL